MENFSEIIGDYDLPESTEQARDEAEAAALEPSAEIAVLAPASRAALSLKTTATEKHLKKLAGKAAVIVAASTLIERTDAHQTAMVLRKARTTIKSTAEMARADANAFCTAVIAEEKRLIGMVKPEEDRLLVLRDGYDAKVAAEKAERERIEAERIAGIRAKIDAIRAIPLGMATAAAFDLAAEREALQAFQTGIEFAEFAADAEEAVASAISALGDLYESAMVREQAARDAEQERLAAIETARLATVEAERVRAENAAEAQRLADLAAELEAAAQRQREADAEKAKKAQAEFAAQQVELARQRQVQDDAARAASDRQTAEREAFEAEKREFAEKQAAVARAAEEAEAATARAAALAQQVEQIVDTIEEVPAAEPEITPEQVTLFAGINDSEGFTSDNAHALFVKQDEEVIDDQEEMNFRYCVRELLITRTADEVTAILADELARFAADL